jgi:hypothetical protein
VDDNTEREGDEQLEDENVEIEEEDKEGDKC